MPFLLHPLLAFALTLPLVEQGIPLVLGWYTNSLIKTRCHISFVLTSSAWKDMHPCSTNICQLSGRLRITAIDAETLLAFLKSDREDQCISMYSMQLRKMRGMDQANKPLKTQAEGCVFSYPIIAPIDFKEVSLMAATRILLVDVQFLAMNVWV